MCVGGGIISENDFVRPVEFDPRQRFLVQAQIANVIDRCYRVYHWLEMFAIVTLLWHIQYLST